jgi:hypothetical protein
MTHHIRIFFIATLLLGLLPGCSQPSGPGAVSGQVKFLSPDGTVRNLPGAQVIVRGAQDTFTAISNSGEGSDPDAGYNYRIESVPPGRYAMAVTPPAGLNLQPEEELNLEVEPNETYAQSALLLPVGVAKPRPLSPQEAGSGQVGYSHNGQNHTYSNSGAGLSDFLLMYLLLRNPGGFGYGAPPVIIGNPGGSSSSSGSSYRVESPPTQTSRGEPISQAPKGVPGQGATRPGSSSSGSSSQPQASSGSGSTVRTPSQGASRPSAPAPSRPSSPSRSSGGSSGGRK